MVDVRDLLAEFTPHPSQPVDAAVVARRARQLRRQRRAVAAAPVALVVAVAAIALGISAGDDHSTRVRTLSPTTTSSAPDTATTVPVAPSTAPATEVLPPSTTSTTTSTVAPPATATTVGPSDHPRSPSTTVTDGDLRITLTLDRVDLAVGEPLTMTIHVIDPTGQLQYADAQFGDASTGPAMAGGCGTHGDNGRGGVDWTESVTYSYFEAGTYAAGVEAQTIAPDCETGSAFQNVYPQITLRVR